VLDAAADADASRGLVGRREVIAQHSTTMLASLAPPSVRVGVCRVEAAARSLSALAGHAISLSVAEADSGGLSVCVHRSVGGGVEVN
jgi:hypothetical protein